MNEWAWRLLLLVMGWLPFAASAHCGATSSRPRLHSRPPSPTLSRALSTRSFLDQYSIPSPEALRPGNCTHQSPRLSKLVMKPGEKQASPLDCSIGHPSFGLVQESNNTSPNWYELLCTSEFSALQEAPPVRPSNLSWGNSQ